MTDAEELRAALQRLGLDTQGIDLSWLAQLWREAEQRILAGRADAEFAGALPALGRQEVPGHGRS